MKKSLLFVGSFPKKDLKIYGGNLIDCEILLNSSLPKKVDLILVDSTQISNPAPNIVFRLLLSFIRMIKYIYTFEKNQPDATLIFTSSGIGIYEKGLMAWYSYLRKTDPFLFPRGDLLSYFKRHGKLSFLHKLVFYPSKKILCQGSSWQSLVVKGLNRDVRFAPVIPNWTARDELLKIGAQKSYQMKNKKKLIYVGWIVKEKGIEELLIAINSLRDNNNLLFDFIGGGAYLEEAKKFVNENNLNDKVKFLGWRPPSFTWVKLSESDIFIFPSWKEGFPNAIVEAMASGLCVITTPVGNIPNFIKHEENGIIIGLKDSSQIKNSILNIINDPEKLKKLSKNSHEFAAKYFNVENAVTNLIRELEL